MASNVADTKREVWYKILVEVRAWVVVEGFTPTGPTFYSDGNTPNQNDPTLVIQQKTLAALNSIP